MKRVISLILLIIVLLLTTTSIFAAQIPHEEINWTNIQTITCALSFFNNQGEAIVSVSGKQGTDSISVNLTIYKQKTDGTWGYVTQTVQSCSSRFFPFTYDFPATPGCTYKLSATVTVIIDGVRETANVSCIDTFE